MFIAISMWGAISTAIICLRQRDMKSLIAYRSVGHMGLVTGGIISNSTWGWFGALVIIVAHGICSPALFALANITYESTNTRRVYLSKGLLILFPAMSFWWFIFRAANMAAPPFINLIGEIMLFTRILSQSFSMLVLLAGSRFLAGAYSLYLYTSVQHGSAPRFRNPFNLFGLRNYSALVLHVFPLLVLVLKADSLFIV